MDADHDVADGDAERGGGIGVVDVGDGLHLEIVIAGAERAHLPPLALLGEVRDALRVGARHAAVLLDPAQVFRAAVAFADGPGRAAG